MDGQWADPAWVDTATVVSDVLAVLRLPPTDPDAARIEELVPTAAALMQAFLDRDDDPLPAAPPMHPLVRQAASQVTIELYRRKDAPFGVLNAWSPDEAATRISTDPLRGVFHVLLPLKLHYGVAG